MEEKEEEEEERLYLRSETRKRVQSNEVEAGISGATQGVFVHNRYS